MVNPGTADEERGRGILTASDRKYLKLSEAEQKEQYSAPARSQRRSAMSDRIQNALLDFQVLQDELEDEIRDEVFNSILGSDVDSKGEFNLVGGRAIQMALAFLYSGTLDYSADRGLFKMLLEGGVESAEQDRDRTVKMFQFEVEPEMVLPWDVIEEQVEHRGVTPRVRRSIMHHLMESPEAIDTDAAVEYLKQG